jgi:hypothetical protein
MNPYFLGRLNGSFAPELMASFDRLEPDPVDYTPTAFRSRFRRFGVFRLAAGMASEAPHAHERFNARRPFHARHGRNVAPLAHEVVASGALQRLIEEVARCPIGGSGSCLVGVNQIRVIADDEHAGVTAPSLHQDGYDLSCHVCVGRCDVQGGISTLSRSQLPSGIFLRHSLSPGEYLFFDDRALFHTASSVRPNPPASVAARDMIILDWLVLP